ncbi:unnamed protein product, partial [Onchocerca ochengi]|uniref:Conserved domain protein n=1 Tax=Onchocerca ochengi TaxID=42157 RepID=A0A182EPD2_ONCOC
MRACNEWWSCAQRWSDIPCHLVVGEIWLRVCTGWCGVMVPRDLDGSSLNTIDGCCRGMSTGIISTDAIQDALQRAKE